MLRISLGRWAGGWAADLALSLLSRSLQPWRLVSLPVKEGICQVVSAPSQSGYLGSHQEPSWQAPSIKPLQWAQFCAKHFIGVWLFSSLKRGSSSPGEETEAQGDWATHPRSHCIWGIEARTWNWFCLTSVLLVLKYIAGSLRPEFAWGTEASCHVHS